MKHLALLLVFVIAAVVILIATLPDEESPKEILLGNEHASGIEKIVGAALEDSESHSKDNSREKHARDKFLSLLGTHGEPDGNSGDSRSDLNPLPKNNLSLGELRMLKRLREEVLTMRRADGDFDHAKFSRQVCAIPSNL